MADDLETAEWLTDAAGWELAEQAYDALERKENERAVELLERAVRSRHTPGDWWHNLGIAYERVHRPRDAAEAFRRAAELDPELADDLETAEWLEANGE